MDGNKNDLIENKKPGLLTSSHSYKPFRYPWAFDFWKRQQQVHWMPEEVPLGEDCKDWVVKLNDNENITSAVCVTGQHREMLDQVLDVFDMQPDIDLDLMSEDQDLFNITSNVISSMKAIYLQNKPDYVIVHGDTSTTMASALAAFCNFICCDKLD